MYSVEVDTVDKDTWYKIIKDFSDANIYQTWSYDEIRFGRKKISHLIVKNDGIIVAAAQVRIVKIPFSAIGIAYVFWGPLWKLKESSINTDIFTRAIRALKSEYAERRGLLLRIYPVLFSDEADVFLPILKNEGFTLLEKENAGRTLLIDLRQDLDVLRKGLDQKWRNCLNRAEKNGLEMIVGEEEGLFVEITKIYWEMVKRKALIELSDINHLKVVQRDLPPNLKLKVILCRLNGETCAGGIFSAIGATAVYHVGATSNAGMKSNGSYIIQWAFIKWLKENGFLYYDLNGINPETNPGTYHFKRGLGGRKGREVEFLGRFQVSDSRVSSWFVKGGDFALSGYRHILRKRRSLGNV